MPSKPVFPKKKAVLAYSGGLDTSVILRTLQERGFDVVAVIVDVGQREDFDRQARRAEAIGASRVYVEGPASRVRDRLHLPGDRGQRGL